MSWTVIGQDNAIRVLSAAARDGRVAHAYLFAGPAHVGKALTAMQFAQLLNCAADERPCGACRSCERIAAGNHPDVEIISPGGLCNEKDHGYDHAKDNSRDIRICQVRRLHDVASRAAFEGSYRVFIIDPAETLNGVRMDPDTTAEAVAALLKTLEEPPANVVIILVTDKEDVLPATIRSRARRVGFSGQAREEIERALRTRWGAEPADAAHIARMAGGRLGWAVSALADTTMLEARADTLDQAEHVAQASLTERFGIAGTLGSGYSRDRARVQATLDLWREWWRDLMLVTAGREEQAVNQDRLDTLRPLAAQCSARGAVRALRAIGDARQHLLENGSPVLVLESMMLALPVLQANAVTTRLRS